MRCGLTGFVEANGAYWPMTIVQTCTVHPIRALMRHVNVKDRRASLTALPMNESGYE